MVRPAYNKQQQPQPRPTANTKAVKQPQVPLTYELYTATVALVTAYWVSTKLVSTKAERLTIIVHNNEWYKTIINTKYTVGDSEPLIMANIYGSEFAKNVTSDVIQALIAG